MSAQLKPHSVIARESFGEVIGEIMPLLEAHFLEIAHFQDIMLEPDFGRYKRAEQSGRLRIYTTRIDDRLVGYAVFVVDHALHYASSLQAVQDVLYVAHEYRLTRLGLRLIRFCDAELKAEGVQVVYQHEKIAFPQLGRLLEFVGYTPVDRLWVRRLDGR